MTMPKRHETVYDPIMPPSRLDLAVEDAIAEQNARFEADPVAQAQARENGERWRRIAEAETAAGRHAVVLPVATAKAILAALKGEPNTLDDFKAGLTTSMLADHIARTEGRA